MLIGQDRSGTTSLKKSLRGQIFNPPEESTVGIEKDPSHFKVTREIWKAGKKNEAKTSKKSVSYEHHAAQIIVNSLKTDERTPAKDLQDPLVPVKTSLPVSASVEDNDTIYEVLDFEESTLEEVQSNFLPIRNVDSPQSHDTPAANSEVLNTDFPDFSTVSTLVSQGDGLSSASDETTLPDEIASLVEKLLLEDKKR